MDDLALGAWSRDERRKVGMKRFCRHYHLLGAYSVTVARSRAGHAAIVA